VDPRQYNRLLIRLLALPVISLAVLALILGFGLQDVLRSNREVDHSDRIIAHTNRLLGLMVDEETGLRGYLLTKDPIFLQPFREAKPALANEFAVLPTLLRRRPEQVAKIQTLEAAHLRWEQESMREIESPPAAGDLEARMLERKTTMDSLRAQAAEFLDVEQHVRDNRSAVANRLGNQSIGVLILVAAVAAFLITWVTLKVFRQLSGVFNEQLEEVRIAAEESYAREQWLNTTLRSIGDAVIACDTDGHVVFMNRIAEELTGWTEPEAHGIPLRTIFPIFNEDTRAVVENPVDKVRRLGTVVGLANHTFLVSKDGTEIAIDDSGAPIRDSAGNLIGIVLVFRDITERRISETALMRSEKLATAGRLAASVAHEVNNPLEGLTNLVYIARHTDELPEIRNLLTQAETELGRIAHITRQSLGFYRETSTPEHFNAAKVVREVTDFYTSRALSQGVTFHVNANTDMQVLGIAGELRQVLSNLLANGLDACPPGASIRVEANPATDIHNPSVNGVRITVADTGCGIHSHHLDRIFEPFFTTKKDTGTGLGLWVSRELVEKHGGRLRVRSSTSHRRSGTVFSIFLPAEGKFSLAHSLPVGRSPNPSDLTYTNGHDKL